MVRLTLDVSFKTAGETRREKETNRKKLNCEDEVLALF